MSARERATYYPPTDYGFSWNYERAREVLASDFEHTAGGVAACIELYQCSLLIETGIRYEDEDDPSYESAKDAARRAKGVSYRLTRKLIVDEGLCHVLDEAEKIHGYGSRVWSLIGACKAFEDVSKDEFLKAVGGNPIRIRRACSVEWPGKEFDGTLAYALVMQPHVAATILVDKYSSASTSGQRLFLPKSFGSGDANEVLKEYLVSDDVNLNYVNAIVAWPSDCGVKLDKETVVLATRVQRRLNNELFGHGGGLRFAVEVAFDPEQHECVSVSLEGTTVRYVYSKEWLMQTLDSASILTNLAVVFNVLGNDKVLPVASNGRYESALLNVLMRPRASFVQNEQSRLEEMRLLACLTGYRTLLKEEGASIESAVEWYFNECLPEVFGLEGLAVRMPTEQTTYLEKCRHIGPEIEKVLKAFSVFVKQGSLDPDYYAVETFGGFENVPSLIANKYVRGASDDYEWEAYQLFSDQSDLSIAVERDDGQGFADAVLLNDLRESDIAPYATDALERLMERHCVRVDEEGRLRLTAKSGALKRMWDYGSVPVAASPRYERVFEGLVEDGEAEYYSCLFSTEESNYLNYVFNRRGFSNSLGLRDKWSHGGGLNVDANGRETMVDYHMLLLVMICVLLKINEELVLHCGADPAAEAVTASI